MLFREEAVWRAGKHVVNVDGGALIVVESENASGFGDHVVDIVVVRRL